MKEISTVTEPGPTAATASVSAESAEQWTPVCRKNELEVERGRAALLDDTQIALFRLVDGSVHAVSNRDPYSGANVISRGIVGTRGDIPTIASPMFKQVFDLRTGECVETQGKPPIGLDVWPVDEREGGVFIRWESRR